MSDYTKTFTFIDGRTSDLSFVHKHEKRTRRNQHKSNLHAYEMAAR